MVAALKRGDEVVTSGGIVGKIERALEDDKLELLISENVTVLIVKSTIQSLLKKTIIHLEKINWLVYIPAQKVIQIAK